MEAQGGAGRPSRKAQLVSGGGRGGADLNHRCSILMLCRQLFPRFISSNTVVPQPLELY